MAFTVTDAINRYVLERQSLREPDGHWHPSEIFGCPRQAIYSHRGTTETNPRDHKSNRTLWLGTQIHEWLQDALREHPEIVEVYTEVHISIPELNIVGDADAIHRTEGSTDWELDEIKSISANGLRFSKAGDLPKPDHKQQGMTYAYALRKYGSVVKEDCTKHPRVPVDPDGMCPNCNTPWKCNGPHEPETKPGCPVVPPLGDSLKRLRFSYIGKDDLGPNEFILPYDPGFEKSLPERIEYLSAYANDANSLPPRLPFTGKQMDTKDWRCRYCPFADLCWNVDGDAIEPEESVW